MPDHALIGPDNPNPVLRQLKFLVVILIVSNIALGLFGVYVLHEMDQKYSDLIGQAVPSMNDLQTLTALETDAMRNTNPALFAEPPQGRAEMLKRAHLALERDRDLRKRILKRQALSLRGTERPDFEESGKEFSQKATEIFKLLESGDDAAAGKAREQSLRPAFDRYIAATTKIADVLEEESLRTSRNLTARTGSMSHMMLGLAGWPVMMMGLFFLLAGLFVIGVLVKVVVFRGEAT